LAKRFDPASIILVLEESGNTRAAIARAAGLDRSTITRYAQGEFRRPSLDAAQRLEKAALMLNTRNRFERKA
jgi:transcriptional regulator with XRE-family HTH domain